MVVLFYSIIICLIIVVSIVLLSGYLEFRRTINIRSIDERIIEVGKRESYVTIKHISKSLIKAVVSIEDHRFYNHNGIDLISLCRALIFNIKKKRLAQGGSTITQQLCKNLLFTNSKTLKRKVSEFFAAVYIERYYSKDKILEVYLNIIYLGNGYYGIKEASYGYYGVSPASLNLRQSTLIAGIIQAPSIFNLKKCDKKELERQKQVMKAMIKYNNRNKK
ncbi:MAG: biosynthetic peptidoglycan transglycosylase [Clostridium sp.]